MNHHGTEVPIAAELLVVALLATAWAYAAAARRGPWPPGRTARWLLGVAAAVAGVVVPGGWSGAHDLRLHVAGHLLLGMVAPLLMVTAAPVTLALRTLPQRHARTSTRLLRSRPAAVATHPAVAAVLDVGGLWVMYRTDLLSAVPPALLDLHMLLAGYLFAFSLVGSDPAPHRRGLGVRAGVLVAAVAAHDVLAKLLFATPAAGVPRGQAETAGLLLYYGAAPVHLVLFVLLGRQWAAGQRRARRRAGPTRPPAAPPRTATRGDRSLTGMAAGTVGTSAGMTDNRPLALVTGASSGIGYELARQFAENGFDVVVNAEDTGLAAAAQELRGTGAAVSEVQADLRTAEGVDALWAAVGATGRPLAAAALNAGLGRGGAFVDIDIADEQEVIDTNVSATVRLAKLVLRDMSGRGEGRVLFTSSIASTMPGAFQAVYNASKSFVQSFAEALQEELKDSGVTITSLMPGPTDTNFFHRADMDDTKVGASGKDDAAQVAEQGFEALMKGEKKLVGGGVGTKLQGAAAKVLPDSVKGKLHRNMAEPGSGD